MDEFTISIPRERAFSTVAELVLGGIAARHDVTIDVLDDLQLALDALLDHVEQDGGDGNVSVLLRVAADHIEASLGPVGDSIAAELEHDAGEGIGLRRLLETTLDDVALRDRDGEPWVQLRKDYVLAGADG
jgi:hypothetical protein